MKFGGTSVQPVILCLILGSRGEGCQGKERERASESECPRMQELVPAHARTKAGLLKPCLRKTLSKSIM